MNNIHKTLILLVNVILYHIKGRKYCKCFGDRILTRILVRTGMK